MKNNGTLQQTMEYLLKIQPDLNCVTEFAADPAQSVQGGKLDGIQVALKDNVSTAGLRTTASSEILDNYVPVYDATIVQKLKDAGAIIVCKTAMDELGMGGTGLNACTGPVGNPWDLSRIPAGSSSGSAAVVAAGAVPLAIGTDTGDSIRKPAAYCGIVGVKPTYGRISRYGIIPYASSLDHVGYFTTGIEDAALALEVLAGRDDHDMTSSNLPVENYAENLNGSLKGRKIGILTNITDRITDPQVRQAFEDLMQQAKEQGAEIVNVRMPDELMDFIAPVYKTIANAEATANHSNLDGLRFGVRKPGESVEEVMTASRTAGFSSQVRERFVVGSYSLFEENQDRIFRKAQKIRRLLVEAYAGLFEQADVIAAPATPDIAPLVEDVLNRPKDAKDRFENEYLQLANFSGYPSLTMPMGTKDGMPLGISLTARPFAEQELFDTALGLENLTGMKGAAHVL